MFLGKSLKQRGKLPKEKKIETQSHQRIGGLKKGKKESTSQM